jgi:hypothetical protein
MKENAASHGSKPRLPFSAEAILQQVERILSDPIFHNSKRCSTLLKFIVANSVSGNLESLKERIIGMEVFDRSPGYETGDDATVRVAANELRKRLLQYYNEPAHRNELRIDVPIRSYVAEFSIPDSPSETKEQKSVASKHRRLRWAFPLVLIGLAILGGVLYRVSTQVSAIDRFWAPMLQSKSPVSISIGGPPAVEAAENTASAKGGAASSATTLHKFLSPQFVFPLTDLTVETAITSYLGVRGKECAMRFAPTTTLAELRGQPLVVIGSLRNEWSLHLGSNLRFHIPIADPPTLNWIEDTSNPADRRWSVDMNAPYDQVTSDYALVSRVFDPTTGQWWIGIAGLTGLGTLAAQQLVVDPDAMSELARKLPPNWDRKNLQIVLAVKIVRGSPGNARMVAAYAW